MTFELKPCPKPVRAKRTRAPLRNKKRMKCGGPMKQYNAKRKGHMFPKNVDEARRDFIRAQACVVTGRATGEWIKRESWMPMTLPKWWKCLVVPAHVKSRGSGGVDQSNMVPLDSRMHDWQGAIGWKAFVKRLKLEAPAKIAADYERRYLLGAA